MAEIRVTNDELIVHVVGFDKVLALHGNLTIPLSHVTGADTDVQEAMKVWVGVKVAGSGIPGVVRAGTWAEGDGFVFWDVHEGNRAIAISLDHEHYKRLVIEVDNPEEAVARINAAVAALARGSG